MASLDENAGDLTDDRSLDRESIIAWVLSEYERLMWELEMKLEWRVRALSSRPVHRIVPVPDSMQRPSPR